MVALGWYSCRHFEHGRRNRVRVKQNFIKDRALDKRNTGRKRGILISVDQRSAEVGLTVATV